MTNLKDAAFWDRISQKYASDPIKDLAGYNRSVERSASFLDSHKSVLELGCGTGSTALRLAPKAGSYVATDISAGMIDIANQKLAETNHPELSFRQATAESLAKEGVVYDVVFAFNYLHLVRDLPETLRHILSLTGPGGYFISKTACLREMNPLIALAIGPMRLLGKAPFVNVFSASELEAEILGAGFEVLARESHATIGKDTRPFFVARRL